MTDRLLHPISDGFRRLGIGKTKGYALVKEGRLHVIKLGRKSLLSHAEIEALASDLLQQAKQEAA